MPRRTCNRLRLGALGLLGLAYLSPAPAKQIGALGRIIPRDGIVSLVGPPGTTIERILVEPDQVVEAGQPLIEFAGKPTLEIELAMAEQARADLVSSGAKAIAIQEAQLAKLRAEGKRADAIQGLNEEAAKQAADFAAEGLARLMKSKAATYSANLRAEKEHQAESTRIALVKARAYAAQAQTQQENSVKLAELELERKKLSHASDLKTADLKVSLAKERLAESTLRAPSKGTVLEIMRKEGETSNGPLIRIADLTRMAVRMLVFQADVLSITPDMTATITSKSLPEDLVGTVGSKGREISADGRVVPVIILLEDAEIASRLLNLEVQVRLSDGR